VRAWCVPCAQVEIKVYKQKVKHLLYEHQNNVAQLKEAGEMALKLQQARPTAPQPPQPASPRLVRAAWHAAGWTPASAALSLRLASSFRPRLPCRNLPPNALACPAILAVPSPVPQEEHRTREAESKKDKRSLKLELKELELAHEDAIRDLKQENDKNITKLRQARRQARTHARHAAVAPSRLAGSHIRARVRWTPVCLRAPLPPSRAPAPDPDRSPSSRCAQEYERMVKELQQKYEKKMKLLREDLELRRKVEILEIEERKNHHINELMKKHEKAFGEIKNYYNDITHNNLDLIRSLKEEVSEMKKKEISNEKLMFEIAQENKKLSEPLTRALKEVEKLRHELANYQKDKMSLQNAKSRLHVLETQLRDLTWEHEVLEQRFGHVEKERDELYEKFESTIYDVQQKSGFKNILLERKLQAINESLEKKEAQLSEVLAAANLDPNMLGAVSKKLDDVLDAKNGAIKDLQYELARVTKAHNDVIRVYESKLTEFGIPVEELGFRPLLTNTGTGPAGLVVA